MYAPTTKQELAKANLTPKAALNRLSKWISSCEPLMKALKRTGYSENQKEITEKQKWLIYRHLGPPQTELSSPKVTNFPHPTV